MLYMKKLAPFFFIAVCILFTATGSVFAGISDDGVWREIDDSGLQQRGLERQIVPDAYRTFRLNRTALRSILRQAPEEYSAEARGGEVILTLPMPDGTFGRFRIEHSLVVEPELLKNYPELGETYRGYGLDDATASVRFDFLPMGFHAMIRSSSGSVFVDPYAKGDTENYISYFKTDLRRTSKFECEVGRKTGFEAIFSPGTSKTSDYISSGSAPEVTSGTQLRTYRLALAATNEYAVAVGGNTIAGTLAAQVLIMNRVNGVYERDVAIHMNIVANNNLVVFAGDNNRCGPGGTSACTNSNDPFTNNDGIAMLSQNTTALNATGSIGTANYDIGHVFSTGGGGVAELEVPCSSFKAEGVTGLSNPVGDAFAIDYVAHEMGHQWGANHTFNGTVSSCGGGNREASAAYEPGSGITIMAYAGICGNQNLAAHSIDTFHVKSLEEIVAYSQTGDGNTCAVTASSGNTPPSVSVVGGPAFNIPKQTPFTLTATGSDVNGDTITYDWQEYDLGAPTTAVPNTDAGGAMPIFRPYVGQASPSRTFPSPQYILANANVPPATTSGFLTGELLPAITRTMTFQVIARDNRANAGGINTATATVNVDGNSGPFAVTAPNTNINVAGGSQQTITWSVANTTAAPVSAANVKISLSTDGGLTFPTLVIASTPNDGTQAVTLPNINTTMARIKVEGLGNIFFDVSDVNFTITASTVKRPFDFDGDGKTDISIFRSAPGEWWYQRSSNGSVFAAQFGTSTDRIAPADFTGDGKTDLAFWRPSTGSWFVLRSENFTFFAFPFGANGDSPVPADYDGDGKADAAVYRSSNNNWFILRSSDGGVTTQAFGIAGDKPVVADYDGDGKADVAIFRPGPGEWWIQKSSGGLLAAQFGSSTDKTVPGDYTGDGKADLAFWRPGTGTWFVVRSEDLSFFAFPFGANGDTPVPGDYDGDGKMDAGVFRSASATWFVNRSTAGVLIQGFGLTTDTPVPNAYVN